MKQQKGGDSKKRESPSSGPIEAPMDNYRESRAILEKLLDTRNRQFNKIKAELHREVQEHKQTRESLAHARQELGFQVKYRTKELAAANQELQKKILELEQAREHLKKTELRFMERDRELRHKTSVLHDFLHQMENVRKRVHHVVKPSGGKKQAIASPPPLLASESPWKASSMPPKFEGWLGLEQTQALLTGQSLTPREFEICHLIRKGMTSKEIASFLQITFQTIEQHRKNIRKKLGLNTHRCNLTSYLRRILHEQKQLGHWRNS